MATATPAVQDKREKLLEVAMKRHQYQPDALIEVLHQAQQLFGYLDRPRLLGIARALKLPPSRVYGVATFYHFFSLKPPGEHTCVLCMGTACYVKGADVILKRMEEAWQVKGGTTRADGKVSLVLARCFGACGLAPVASFDGTVVGNLSPETTLKHAEGWLHDGPR